MLRMPATPSKGATIFSRARVARASASLASATCRLAALSSTARCAMNFSSTSSWLRLWFARAMETSASACFTCAIGNWSSSCTSSWPRRTRWASPKLICVTRPDTSGRSTMLWRERRLPTACASSVILWVSTRATSTAGARPGALAPPAAGLALPLPLPLPLPRSVGAAAVAASPGSACRGFCSHQAAPEAAAIPTTATTV